MKIKSKKEGVDFIGDSTELAEILLCAIEQGFCKEIRINGVLYVERGKKK